MTRQVGRLLRMIGPLIQVACLILLMRPGSRGWQVAGRPVETYLYGGMLVGLVLVVVGIGLSAAPAPRRGK